MKSIYLDYAAATPTDPKVLEAMLPYFSECFHNPSAIYLSSRDARLKLESMRSRASQQLGAKSTEIVFTAGATEANNLAIAGIMNQYPDGEILVSSIEHDSVLEPAKQHKHRLIPTKSDGVVDLAKLEKMIKPNTVMVSIMYVNNELGTIQPISEISKLLNKLSNSRKLPIYFHTDAAQAANLFDLHVSRLGVDLMSLNGGKIYGPKQSGALYVKAGVKLEPIIRGGGQEHGLRSGTESLAAAAGFSEALSTAQTKRDSERKRLADLRQWFIEELASKIPTAVINGSTKHQSPHLVNITFPSVDNERLVMELDEAGIQAAVGSACSASNDEPSHVLTAIGLNRAEAQSTIRLSFGRQTTKPDLEKCLAELARLTASNR